MEKLFAKIKKQTLSQQEKNEILNVLNNFVDANPPQRIRSPFFDYHMIFARPMSIAVIIFIPIFLTSGLVLAAQSSLPGNTLYPVKMLKENVESLVALSPKTKAEIETTHAISRLQEVEQIIVESGQLKTETRQKIENNFESQVQNATSQINKLKDRGHTEAALKVENSLKSKLVEREKSMSDLSESTSTEAKTKKELSNIISNVRSKIEDKDKEENERSEPEQNKSSGEVKGEKYEPENRAEKADYSKIKNKKR